MTRAEAEQIVDGYYDWFAEAAASGAEYRAADVVALADRFYAAQVRLGDYEQIRLAREGAAALRRQAAAAA